MRRLIPRLLTILILCIGLGSTLIAQGGALTYGTVLTGTLNPGSPMIYTFSGNANDVATVYVIGSGELQTTLSLSNSSGQQLAFSTGDALTPMQNDARVTALLPANDTYIVTLNNLSDVGGTFLLALSVADPIAGITLIEPTTVTIEPNAPAQQFIVAGSSQVLSIQNLRTDAGFTAQLQSADGQILASIAGGLDGTSFVLPFSDSPYILTVDAQDSALGAMVALEILGDVPAPVSTEEVQAPTDPNVCTITGNAVNIRTGPGTNFDAIGTLVDGVQFIATGQNSGWYNGTYNGQSAWVAAGVVNASGNCANLPTVQAPAAPVQSATQDTQNTQPTSTPVPTDNSGNQQQPPTATPTTAATEVPFTVNSLSCRYLQNDGATVDFNVNGPASAQFRVDVRQGNTTYSVDRTLNQQGFLIGNQRFGQAGNSNYTAYIVYNGVDIANAPC